MQNPELVRQHAKLRSLIRRAGHAGLNDIELQAHWARYLCVLVAGFIENSLRLTFGSFVKTSSSPKITRYVETRLKRLQNPNSQKIIELTQSFDDAWGKALSAFLEDNSRKDAIDGIMSNRHLVAHGRDSGITVARIEQYLMRVVETVEFLETQTRTPDR